MSLPECIENLVGKWITSPRNEAFDVEAQRYRIKNMDDYGQFLEILFESGTLLRIHYWRFNHVIDMLLNTSEDYLVVGTRIDPDDYSTVQGSMYQEAIRKGYVQANMRMASFVCDIIVLCGYAEYGITINLSSGRKVQGIRKTSKLVSS
jgi:hypothetical protein